MQTSLDSPRLPDPASDGAFRRELAQAAAERYRSSGRFAWHFARGKLAGDPLFADLLRHGQLPPRARFLDLGCGQAVLASWLLAARERFARGGWPAHWPEPPELLSLTGYELMPADVERARLPFADEARVRIEQADICRQAYASADVVTLLDVLHYFDFARQDDVLRRVWAALPPGGVFVTRVGDAAAGWRFGLSLWVDRVVTFVRGHGWSRMYTRPLADWTRALQAAGFEVRPPLPSVEGPPFANVMLVCRKPVGAAA
ncbi:MAG TPA: class I SAM-dependent methyltransferase [Burkholderiaceae bacterium]|mgnify:FL=1|jgi:SAM-dependent methyltransferase|nr:class I SAM-dependent methyltransferase [Burkholderiaceae bacterium]